MFSFASPTFKKFGRPADSFSDEELQDLILAEPRFLRRPVIVNHDRVVIGLKAIQTL